MKLFFGVIAAVLFVRSSFAAENTANKFDFVDSRDSVTVTCTGTCRLIKGVIYHLKPKERPKVKHRLL